MIKEAQLIKLAQSGNSTAFGKLVNRYWNKVFLLTTKYCKLEEDKEDIVQETFIQAWQNIKRFQRNSTFFFWLCKIALNLIYEKRRKERFKTIYLHSLPPDYGVHLIIRFSLKEFFDKQYDILAQQLIGHSTDTVTAPVTSGDSPKIPYRFSQRAELKRNGGRRESGKGLSGVTKLKILDRIWGNSQKQEKI